mmetsp:Transcript_45537/g.145303  ORF Transcript_45537/g.145303 Transcript_45537/m.145303 type:complete len:200 (-) Transcript_45537:564-1163(-)
MSVLRIRPEAVGRGQTTPVIGSRLMLCPVIKLSSLRDNFATGTLHHFNTGSLRRIQPPVGPKVQQPQRLRRRRVHGVRTGLDDDLVDSQKRDVLPSSQESGLSALRAILEGQHLSCQSLLLDCRLNLGIRHCRLANDRKLPGPDQEYRSKDHLLAGLPSMQLLTHHEVTDCDLVLVHDARLEDRKCLRGVYLRDGAGLR